MQLQKAIEILESHNEWRRDNGENPVHVMADPKELGVAIDTVVNHYKKPRPDSNKMKVAIDKFKEEMLEAGFDAEKDKWIKVIF